MRAFLDAVYAVALVAAYLILVTILHEVTT